MFVNNLLKTTHYDDISSSRAWGRHCAALVTLLNSPSIVTSQEVEPVFILLFALGFGSSWFGMSLNCEVQHGYNSSKG